MTGTATKNNIFTPQQWQIAPFRDKSFIMLLDGGAGGGKSHLAAHKIDAYMRKYPNSTGLLVRKTRESMTNSTLLFFSTQVIKNDPNVRWKKQDKRFEYSNGSVLAYGGMKDDAQREAIRGIGQDSGLDIVWMEEAHLFTMNDFEELLPRMRGKAAPWRQIILTTNPDSEYHWIYQRLIKEGEASRYRSFASDNTYNPDDYESNVLDRLTGSRKQRMKGGKWVSSEGAVYEDFNRAIHVIDPFEIPSTWRRFRAIDFGFTNPFVCQWWAMDHDGRLYLYREIYMSKRTVADHAKQIIELSAGENIEYTIADSADAQARKTLEQNGIKNIPTKKGKDSIIQGIERVQLRLRDAGDGKPRLFFLEGATVEIDPLMVEAKKPTSTADEMPGYSYPDGVDGKPNKEIPIDADNHGNDAMRYMMESLDRQLTANIITIPDIFGHDL